MVHYFQVSMVWYINTIILTFFQLFTFGYTAILCHKFTTITRLIYQNAYLYCRKTVKLDEMTCGLARGDLVMI